MDWRETRRRMAATAAAVLFLPTAAALACAPSPIEAGETFLRAIAGCDFPTAWRILAESERAVFPGGVLAWTQDQGREAADAFGCRALVEDVRTESEPGAPRVAVRYTLAEPAVVESFRRLLDERQTARIAEWDSLDRMIRDARGRMLLMDSWEPRIRTVRVLAAERQEGADPPAWCVVAGYAAMAAVQRAELARMEAENARWQAEARQRDAERAQREAQDTEALRRGEAARPMVAVEAVRVGETVLREPGVWGEIVNRSPEALRAVRIRVDYLDAAGAVVGYREYSPLLHLGETSVVPRADHMPLPPGQRRRFGVRAEDAPSTWSRRVRVEVIRVEADPSRLPADPPVQPQPAGARRPAR